MAFSPSSISHRTEILVISDHDLKMIAETFKPVFKYSPAAPDAGDADFNIVSCVHIKSIGSVDVKVKVKGDFSEAATERLTTTATAAAERLATTTAAAAERLTATTTAAAERYAVSTAIAATPFILGGLGGLAIWKMAGRRAPKVTKATMGVRQLRTPFAMRTKTKHV
ncbi:hypothetical protein B0T14DRAFT_599065 [Immersiella caudata]|uniref:Uncharacterized protein n=1 Tax=Immersiella caudata TaxID=314043 RepID=A0AA39XH47_9PEZI|nr:hypothetical protein B0T14DRAFT_599065 [Immersiella caudata]